MKSVVFFFFFQAEDGIRDLTVTGVQTCALPISPDRGTVHVRGSKFLRQSRLVAIGHESEDIRYYRSCPSETYRLHMYDLHKDQGRQLRKDSATQPSVLPRVLHSTPTNDQRKDPSGFPSGASRGAVLRRSEGNHRQESVFNAC